MTMHPALPIIARIARCDVNQLTLATRLDAVGLSSSIGLSVLRSALERRFQARLAPLAWTMTIADVVDQLSSTAAPTAGPAPVAPANLARPVPPLAAMPALPGHGIDIQEVAGLPAPVAGGEGDAFYASHFSAAERETARTRPDARTHLCGIWCAKEAVKKSNAALLGLEYHEIRIAHAPDGRPTAEILRPDLAARFALVLSISHSGAYAVASVLAFSR